MKIKLHPLDYSGYSVPEQLCKVLEELKELEMAGSNIEQVAEETFDVIQALVGYLITLGVDVEDANKKHIEKMERRHGNGSKKTA